jgi:hypothetical protein
MYCGNPEKYASFIRIQALCSGGTAIKTRQARSRRVDLNGVKWIDPGSGDSYDASLS